MFTLRYPFSLGSDRLKDLNERGPSARAGVNFSLSHGANGQYVIEASLLPTKEDAERLAGRLWLGFMVNQLKTRRRVVCTPTLAPVAASADPAGTRGVLGLDRPVFGVADGERPCVYETARRPLFMFAGTGTAYVSTPADRLLGPVVEASDHPAENVMDNAKLRTAIDLFSLSLAQSDDTARFLSTIMGIESLTTPADRHPLATQFLSRWKAEVEAEKALHRDSSEERAVLADLEREVLFRNRASIRSRVKGLVMETLRSDADVEQVARKTVAAYDRRSALVHTGALPHAELVEAGQDAVEALTRILLAKIAQSSA